MTLKAGRQRDHFTRVLNEYRPGLEAEYEILYGRSDRYGGVHPDYHRSLDLILRRAAERHRLPLRMPPGLYADLLDDNDRVAVMLSHLDFFTRTDGARTPFGAAATAISRLERPLDDMFFDIRSITGVGTVHRAGDHRDPQDRELCQARGVLSEEGPGIASKPDFSRTLAMQ